MANLLVIRHDEQSEFVCSFFGYITQYKQDMQYMYNITMRQIT